MPKHKIHNYADKLWFGKSFPKVHEAIDLPYIVYGRSHRRFFHTYKEAYPIGYIVSGEATGALSGVFHVWLDKECSKDKVFMRWLDWQAKEDARFSKQMARQAKVMRRKRAKNDARSNCLSRTGGVKTLSICHKYSSKTGGVANPLACASRVG